MKKLPDDAFGFYLGMGQRRSYQAVADHFDVDKKTVTNRAVKEDWKGRLAAHEKANRERIEKQAAESLEAMNDRQLKVLSFIQGKAIQALKDMPLDSAMDAVRAFAIAVEKERLIRGEPSQRTAVDIEQQIRSEHERWLVPADEPEPAPEPEPTPAADADPVTVAAPEPEVTPEPEAPIDAGSPIQEPGEAA